MVLNLDSYWSFYLILVENDDEVQIPSADEVEVREIIAGEVANDFKTLNMYLNSEQYKNPSSFLNWVLEQNVKEVEELHVSYMYYNQNGILIIILKDPSSYSNPEKSPIALQQFLKKHKISFTPSTIGIFHCILH